MGNSLPVYRDNESLLARTYVRLCGLDKKPNVKPWNSLRRLEDILNKRNIDVIYTGSFYEGLRIPSTQQMQFDEKRGNKRVKKERQSDLDFMLVNRDKTISLDKSDSSSYAYVESRFCHAGYTQLKHTECGELLTHDDITKEIHTQSHLNLFYMAVKGTPQSVHNNPMGVEVQHARKEEHGPALTFSILEGTDMMKLNDAVEVDLVPAVRCKHWPEVANEWLTRDRQNGWPAPELIEHIYNYGCHIVPVCYCFSEQRETEFRFSFSMAEKMIAHSLTDVQRTAYIVAKILFYHHIKPLGIISSYHLKTCLFWVCEESEPTRWTWDNFQDCYKSILFKLLRCVEKESTVQNYFIRENNMVDHINEDDIKKLIDPLKDIIYNPIRCLSEVAALYKQDINNITVDIRVLFNEFLDLNTRGSNLSLVETIFDPVFSDMSNEDPIQSVEHRIQVLMMGCVAHLMFGFRKDINEIFFDIFRGVANEGDEQNTSFEMFIELNEMLKDRLHGLSLCLLVTSMLINIVCSQVYKCSRRKINTLRLSIEKILETHKHTDICKKYHEECWNYIAYVCYLRDIAESKESSEALSAISYKTTESVAALDNHFMDFFKINYLLTDNDLKQCQEVLKILQEKYKSDKDTNLVLKSMDEVCRYEEHFHFKVINWIDEIKKGTIPNSHIEWNGILSFCTSLILPMKCIINYYKVVCAHKSKEPCQEEADEMSQTWQLNCNSSDILLLVGHALYLAKKYDLASRYFASVLDKADNATAATYLELCLACSPNQIVLSNKTKISKRRSFTEEAIPHIMNIFSDLQIDDVLKLIPYLGKQNNEIVQICLARSMEMRWKRSDECDRDMIYDLVQNCYEIAIKRSQNISSYCYFICFILQDQVKRTSDVIKVLETALNLKRITTQTFVHFQGDALSVLPSNLQKELQVSNYLKAPSNLFLFLLLCEVMSVNVLDRNDSRHHSENDILEVTPTVHTILNVIMDRKQIQKNVSCWLKKYGQSKQNKLEAFHIGKICLLIFRSQMISKTEDDKSEFVCDDDLPGSINIKNQAALFSSHCRFRKGHFKMSFGLYRMFMDATKDVCIENCSPQLHYSHVIWSDAMDDTSEESIKLSIHCLKYMIEYECANIPDSHLQHIKVLLSLLCFHRHNQLENQSDDDEDNEPKPSTSKQLDYTYVPDFTRKTDDLESKLEKAQQFIHGNASAEEIPELNNIEICIDTLQGIIDENSGLGLVHAILGNILYFQGRLQEAKNLLGKALDMGTDQLPLHIQYNNPHYLVTESRHLPTHGLMNCEKLFQIFIPVDHYGFFASYVVYATYLYITTFGPDLKNITEDMTACFKAIIKKVGKCDGKFALFGIICLKLCKYSRAKRAFEEELKLEKMEKKKPLLEGFVAISHYLEIIEQGDEEQAGEYCEEFLDDVVDTEIKLEKK